MEGTPKASLGAKQVNIIKLALDIGRILWYETRKFKTGRKARWKGFVSYEHCDYHNYCGEIEVALRKLSNQVSKAFRSSELRKAFFNLRPGSSENEIAASLTAGNYRFMLLSLYFLI